RDIEYLEISLRAPLVYVAKYRGYAYEDKTYVLPLLYVTEEERQVLKYLAYRYRHHDGDNAAAVNRVAHLLERFTDEQEASAYTVLPAFDTNPHLIQTIELLSRAMRQSV